MDKKTECEIVQDLLISYADDVLNQSSKKMVEMHLIECEKCRKKLQEIESDLHKNEETQKKQIDYLKKLRRRSKLKAILGAALILFVIFASWYLYKFCTIYGISRKLEKQFEVENFYIENISSCDENKVAFSKTWYKNGKYKVVSYIEENGEIIQKFETKYGDFLQNSKEEFLINEEEKKAHKEKMLFKKNKSDIISQQSSFVLTWDLNNPYQYIVAKLGEPFYVRISTDHKQIGRKYYVLNFGETEKWVDIETGLLIMSFGDILGTNFYPNTNIPKQEFRSASEYHYEFGKVTDEDVQMPDLSGYEVEEFDWKEIFEN